MISGHAAERALRGVALGRKAWLFAGSDRGGKRAAAIYTLIATACPCAVSRTKPWFLRFMVRGSPPDR